MRGVPSKRLILSYLLDWVIIIAFALAGYGFYKIRPYHRPFSLVDLNISFPYQTQERIPTWLLIVVAVIAPGAIIFLVCLIFVPGPTVNRNTPKSLIWRRKLWEWNTGWMGLLMSLAVSFALTQGMKNLFGRPRPDLLSRCKPDYNKVKDHTVGGYAEGFAKEWVLVTSGICTETNMAILNDGFQSFPSGHASTSWAGLLYLSLFLCSKFSIAIPYLSNRPYSISNRHLAMEEKFSLHIPGHDPRSPSTTSDSFSNKKFDDSTDSKVPTRNQAAAPPLFLFVIALIPIGGAVYVTSTRYTDFRHKGVDLTAGSLLGILVAYISFRWFHLPIRSGGGWSYGARSRSRAFGIGVGVGNYVGPEGWAPKGARANHDVESEGGILSAGFHDEDGQNAGTTNGTNGTNGIHHDSRPNSRRQPATAETHAL